MNRRSLLPALFAVAFIPTIFSAAAAGGVEYPQTRRVDHVDTYFGARVPDPYCWLEADVRTDREVADWVATENRVTTRYLQAIPEREAIRRRLTELWNFPQYSGAFKAGGRYYFMKNDGLQNQAVLYVMDSLEAAPRPILDPNTWSADGTVALAGMGFSDDGHYMAFGRSEAGSDWSVWHVMEIASGKVLPDEIRWTKFTHAAWTKDGKGFYYSRYEEPKKGAEFHALNFNNRLYYHRLGDPQSADTLTYYRAEHPDWEYAGVVTEDGRWLLVTTHSSSGPRNRVTIFDLSRPGTKPIELVDNFEHEFGFVGNVGSLFYFQTDLDAPRRRLVAVDISKSGPPDWKEIIPQAGPTLLHVGFVGDRFIASYLEDVKPKTRVFDRDGRFIRDVQYPAIGSAGGFGGKRSDTDTFYTFSSFATPPTVYRYDVKSGESAIFRRPQLKFNPGDFEVKQIFYTSKDGTRVPMFLVYRKGLKLDGSNPTLLYGYGGFNISQLPGFSVGRLAWLEMGGVFAEPNLRGGGEYGEAWHKAGTKLQKQNVFDDFIAAGQWLIANRYTRPDKLAISGGSNGGLLVGAVMTQRPELFGACLPAVGVMDMLRFHKFTEGRTWVDDYGSSDNPEQFKALLKYSPYHNIRPGTCYPATLVTTADTDDRVVPGHSFKFAAALQDAQACDKPVLIRIETRAGHGGGKPTSKRIAEVTDLWAFLVKNLGMTLPQCFARTPNVETWSTAVGDVAFAKASVACVASLQIAGTPFDGPVSRDIQREDSKTQSKSVKSIELLSEVKIIGVLGHPWGKMLTISGDVRESDDGKSRCRFLVVGYVNGKKLDPPADIVVGQLKSFSSAKEVEFKEGRKYELRGYEYGAVMDFPREAVDEAVKSHDESMTYDYVKFGWRFVPRFNYLSAKEVPPRGESKGGSAQGEKSGVSQSERRPIGVPRSVPVTFAALSTVTERSVICVDPLCKVFRGATDLPSTEPVAHAAVGECATVQFVFRSANAVPELTATVSGDMPGAAARFVGYVKVGHSYGGAPADVLKSADRMFPDPLLEDASVAVAANQNQPVWITVPATKPGEHRGELTLRWDGGELRQPFKVIVHNVTMKKPRLWVTNWWFADADRLAMLAGHRVTMYSDEYWKLIRQFADFMARYRQNVIMVSPLDLTQITHKAEKWRFDFSRFDQMVQTFIDAGVVGRIEGGHIGGRSSGDWNSKFHIRVAKYESGAVHFVNLPPDAAAARQFYGQYLPALARHLADRGWDKLYRQHLADEPIPANAASYRQLANLVHEFAPGMMTMDATQTRDLVGAVNTWVPILDHFHHDYSFFRQRRKAGDEVWTYTCCGPTGDYANRFIELPLLKTRLLHWINFRYAATGYLHWGFNYWNASSPFGETAFQWPGGDQWIVYPKGGKLLSSIRLEAMRDGIGDHELLSMLADRGGPTADKLAAETVLDFNRYDMDINHFRARRLQMLEALEK